MSLFFHIAPAPGLALAAEVRPPAPAPLRRAAGVLGSPRPGATLAILRARDGGARAVPAAVALGRPLVSR
jgi:hypothetical protein